MRQCRMVFVWLVGFGFPWFAAADVVINELNYDPIDVNTDGGGLREFIELYNPGPGQVDLSGYEFTNGITYTFPSGTMIAADSYLVLARVPTHRSWRNKTYRIVGPYEGKLSNGGERLTLRRPDRTVVEDFQYDDDAPWPRGADGYGPTLERIVWDLPAEDYHSWRTSLMDDGTPGARNSVYGTPPRPVITAVQLAPPFPTSSDTVQIQVGVDSPSIIAAALLKLETSRTGTSAPFRSLVNSGDEWKYWKGRTSPSSGLACTQPNFDDSSWNSGVGGFGYGDLDQVNTVLDDMRNNYSTFYIRRSFTVEDPDSVQTLTLNIYYDDGFICYLNGTEVARASAPTTYTHQSVATVSHESTLTTIELGPARTPLRSGINTLALVGFNITLGGSTDFVLAPTLVASLVDTTANRFPMQITAETPDSATLTATLPQFDSQTLVRYSLEIELTDGRTLLLPHNGERHPFASFFVYDGEMASRLPLLWIYDSLNSTLPETPRRFNAVVTCDPGERTAQVFDGVEYIRSESGNKIRFNKGEEYRGDRTINLMPESPPFSGTAGSTGPFREYLGHWFYRHMGNIAPRADWFRVIENVGTPTQTQTQRLIIQQVNERFLEMNGRDPEGDLYKLEWNIGFVKHTNLDEGNESIQNLVSALQTTNQVQLHEAILNNLIVEEFLSYSAVSVLMSNWDGFFNNNWMYLDPEPGSKWEIIPWDLDKVWGFTDENSQYYQMSPQYPLDGRAAAGARRPGDITGPFHRDTSMHTEYLRRLRVALDREYAPNAPVYQEIERDEKQLNDDLDLLEQMLGRTQTNRRNQIANSYRVIREFLELRRGFLNQSLPTPVEDWALY